MTVAFGSKNTENSSKIHPDALADQQTVSFESKHSVHIHKTIKFSRCHRLLVLLISNSICLSLCAAVDPQCDPDQIQQLPTMCFVIGVSANVTGADLVINNIAQPKQINTLVFTAPAELKTFPSRILQNLPELIILLLQNSGIESLNQHSIVGATNLLTLELSDNRINKLPADVFRNAINLDILELNRNGLQVIDDYAFRGLDRLKTLSLEQNQITTLTNFTFDGLSSLQALHLTRNRLSALPNGALHMNDLRVLGLAHNQLTAIPHQLCTTVRHLTTLNVGYNAIETIDGSLSHCDRLQFVYMDNNRIRHVDWNVFTRLARLESFSLNSNQIELVNVTATPSNSPVNTIYLESNQLSAPNLFELLRMFGNLRTIYLHNNGFTHFERIEELPRWYPHLESIEMTNNTNFQQWAKDHEQAFGQMRILLITMDNRDMDIIQ